MQNIESYEEVDRWLTALDAGSKSLDFSKSSTKRSAIYWLKRYCKFLKTNPKKLIDNRNHTLRAQDEVVRRTHEEKLQKFSLHLRSKKYSPNTISTAIGMIRSFYKHNYADLKKIQTISPRPIRPHKVPETKDIKKMCEIADLPIKTWLLSQFNSGLGNTDLMSLRLSTLSSEYGTLKQQIVKDVVPIHIEVRRQKTGERTDSFLGPNAIEVLEEYIDFKENTIFHPSIRTIQKKVKEIAIEAGVATKEVPVTPYGLRRAFNTIMKLDGVNEALVERMMGHSIGRVRSAYLVTGRDEQVSGIPISKLADLYMQHYDAIDITKV